MRYRGRLDVMLAEVAPGAALAGVFTRSATRSAPVLWCEEKLAALASAGAGDGRLRHPRQLRQRQRLHRRRRARGGARRRSPRLRRRARRARGPCPRRLDRRHRRAAAGRADRRGDRRRCATGSPPDAAERAARAIMTTDTFPKGAGGAARSRRRAGDDHGLRQGLGHDRARHGDDARLPLHRRAPCRSRSCRRIVREGRTTQTFNCITVDGDTSTSDTLLMAATGRAAMAPLARRRRPARAPPSRRR